MRHPFTGHLRSAAQRRLFFWTQRWDAEAAREHGDAATRFGDDSTHATARAAVRARAPEDEDDVLE
ncbi:hypothetical protein IMZ29_00060 [Achromobacter sp. GG226]|uniref:hypothetical protein n=1 Tax=Verticiella alkaliphila TaxID=2779529 RepID=UPI001C0B121C|nr:hypothetical protein [Verticiella sp. GG226]MBU4609002.1 hypothetical protein [Verticiella sp. GG226]